MSGARSKVPDVIEAFGLIRDHAHGTTPAQAAVTLTPQQRVEVSDEWKAQGACHDHPDPQIFFPERSESAAPAKAVCRDCPVRAACLEYALVNFEKHGIWGGTSERERQRIRRRRRLTQQEDVA